MDSEYEVGLFINVMQTSVKYFEGYFGVPFCFFFKARANSLDCYYCYR